MELHIVNGFLGSGKTTAILNAARYYQEKGLNIAIVTNDKGRFQVDSDYFDTHSIPVRQITGGCFRCSYGDFEEHIGYLQKKHSPDILFAESVGSCVDLVNTIFPSLQKNSRLKISKATFSVFTDIRLFSRWLYQEPSPFTDHVNYLFTKQIEESNLLVINKTDLLSATDRDKILYIVKEKLAGKTILLQNSHDPACIQTWMNHLEKEPDWISRPGFTVDYPKYKDGEKEMAWLDQMLTIKSKSPEQSVRTLQEIIRFIIAAIMEKKIFVGHIKFLIGSGENRQKISFTTADFFQNAIPPLQVETLRSAVKTNLLFVVNARISMEAGEFLRLVTQAVGFSTRLTGSSVEIEEGSSYNPEMSMSHP